MTDSQLTSNMLQPSVLIVIVIWTQNEASSQECNLSCTACQEEAKVAATGMTSTPQLQGLRCKFTLKDWLPSLLVVC